MYAIQKFVFIDLVHTVTITPPRTSYYVFSALSVLSSFSTHPKQKTQRQKKVENALFLRRVRGRAVSWTGGLVDGRSRGRAVSWTGGGGGSRGRGSIFYNYCFIFAFRYDVSGMSSSDQNIMLPIPKCSTSECSHSCADIVSKFNLLVLCTVYIYRENRTTVAEIPGYNPRPFQFVRKVLSFRASRRV